MTANKPDTPLAHVHVHGWILQVCSDKALRMASRRSSPISGFRMETLGSSSVRALSTPLGGGPSLPSPRPCFLKCLNAPQNSWLSMDHQCVQLVCAMHPEPSWDTKGGKCPCRRFYGKVEDGKWVPGEKVRIQLPTSQLHKGAPVEHFTNLCESCSSVGVRS
jgi:hypothetical protein